LEHTFLRAPLSMFRAPLRCAPSSLGISDLVEHGPVTLLYDLLVFEVTLQWIFSKRGLEDVLQIE
jgi:hypothetical protein